MGVFDFIYNLRRCSLWQRDIISTIVEFVKLIAETVAKFIK
ncbi:delta-lysin family phenol-soluble modulin [Staphylococcus pseudintermedius]|uniref:Delta-hemolysin n=1 Tax=Staphylococcus pseudintermedius TaxID=283734 RepID=A0A7T7SWZ0_STAPS|nr:delta-lysin family phenol-soluble modulin [Staphylococcus pseudintermedius]